MDFEDLLLSRPEVKPSVRIPLGRQIAGALRSEILLGRLPVGTTLSQRELCERFDTSRIPARDAVLQLTLEGFLEPDEKGRIRVAALGRQDLEDLLLVEGSMRGLIARRVTEGASDEDLERLRRLHERMDAAAEVADPKLVALLGAEFHRSITEMATSHRMLAALRTLSLAFPAHHAQQPDRHLKQHQQILEAMLHRDGEAAEQLMRHHIVEPGLDFISSLAEQTFLS